MYEAFLVQSILPSHQKSLAPDTSITVVAYLGNNSHSNSLVCIGFRLLHANHSSASSHLSSSFRTHTYTHTFFPSVLTSPPTHFHGINIATFFPPQFLLLLLQCFYYHFYFISSLPSYAILSHHLGSNRTFSYVGIWTTTPTSSDTYSVTENRSLCRAQQSVCLVSVLETSVFAKDILCVSVEECFACSTLVRR